MKCENCPSEIDSLSTQQRIKKFHRKSTSKSPRSKSNHSESQSISKFFVFNLQVDQKSDKIDEILTKQIKVSNDWSPPTRQPTPAKGTQNKNEQNQKELREIEKKQKQNLKLEVQKYKIYIQQQQQKLKRVLFLNKTMGEEVLDLKRHLMKEKEKNNILNEKISQLLIDQHQPQASQLHIKQQPSLQKMKGMIFQSRIIEFQKERECLNKRIKQLEEIVAQNKISWKNTPQNKALGTKQPLMPQKSTIDEQDHLSKLQSQLYDAKQCIKRLQISETCCKRKYNTEFQIYSKRRDKEYQQLRNKFNQFLNKYKFTMKQMASFKVQNAFGCQIQRCSSIESFASFTLSEGD